MGLPLQDKTNGYEKKKKTDTDLLDYTHTVKPVA